MNNRSVLLPLLLLISCSGSDTIRPVTKPLTEAVYASGYVVSQGEYEVLAQAEGYVTEKVVNDGDVVKKGDPIYILESGQQSSRFDLAQKNFAIASQNYSGTSPVLQETEAMLKTSRTKYQYDSVNYGRYKNLLERNATSRAEFDRMRLLYENSANEYALQRSRYRKVQDQLYLELQNAKSQLTVAGNEAGKYIVRSEVDGIVFKMAKEKGELVRRTESIAVLGNANSYYLQLSIDELDINRIKKGQEVLVTVDAYSSNVFHATVDKVYPMVNQQQQSVRVDAVLRDSLPGSFSGLAVEANIIIQHKDRALVIPKTALVGADSVVVVSNGDEKIVRIVKGIQTLEEVEIIHGLEANTELLLRDKE
jgi:HlyD family secretion protein